MISGALMAAVALSTLGSAPAPAAVPLAVDWQRTANQISTSCTAEIARANARLTALSGSAAQQTFDGIVVPLETILADLNDATVADQFLANVAADRAVRDASRACNSAESAFVSEVTARPALFAALHAARSSKTAAGPAQTKLTDLWLTASQRAGAGLADAQRDLFVKLSAQLSDLQNQFGANLGNDASTIVLRPAEIAGLPPDFVATFGRAGDTYVVPVNESTYTPFMQNASVENARRTFYLTYANRGGAANVALLERAIAMRDRLAHLFGYADWAAYVLADKMAQTPQRVTSFLDNIDRAILPKARAERAELAALKGGPEFSAWDVPYYQNVLRKERYRVDGTALKQYFPVGHTVDAVLAIYARLLGVTFKPIAPPGLYDLQVSAYEVDDADSRALLGTFLLDLYPRPGKYNHFANFPLVARRVLPDGTIRAPLAAIVGNWSRPAPGQPALLSHDEVQTFFHEFGHNMAAMLAAEPYASLNSGFRADFIEAPSQMLENWVWDPAILKQISANVVTGQPLPDALISQLVAARYVDYALSTTQQILYADVDMRFHTSGSAVDTTAIWQQTVPAVTPNAFVAGSHPQAAFGHLMGGYDAGYYGYLWSKVYAQDMFSAFRSAGLQNPDVGRRYRTTILAPARTYEPDAEVAAFLGRSMSPTAFYSELGIAPQATLR